MPTDALEPFPEDWAVALAVVAHPDDVEFGASCAVARWTSLGRRVGYLLVTRGEAGIDAVAPERAGPLREAEQRRAAALVGVDSVEFLDHRDGLVEYGVALRRDIARAVRRHRPEVVVSLTHRLQLGPAVVNSADHRAVGLAVLDGVRDAANRWVFAEDGEPAWSGVRFIAFAASPRPTHAVDVEGHVEAGVASLSAHAAYLDGLGGSVDPRRLLDEQTRAAGRRAGCAHAVAFEVVPV